MRKIEIVVKGTPKEIADLVLGVQNRHETVEIIKNSLGEEIIVRQTEKGTVSPKELLMDSINAVLHEKNHDTSEEKPD